MFDLVIAVAVILLVLFILPVLFIFFPLAFGGAPYEPMPRDTARAMLALADVKPGETVYDLGSGDGRVVTIAADEFGADAVGIELSYIRAAYARRQIRRAGADHARIVRGNFFKHDFSDADVVTMFQLQPTNDLLEKRLEAVLKPGTRVVSYVWVMKNWKPAREDKENRIQMYTIGNHSLYESAGTTQPKQ